MLKTVTKLFLSFSIPLLIASNAYAQTGDGNGTITGSLEDEKQKPAPYVTVTLCKAADTIVIRKALTTETGSYSFDQVPAGTYLISAEWIGYKKTYTAVFSLTAGQAFTVKALTLSPDSRQLQTVNIISKKPLVEHKNDKVILNVANSILATGNSALEILAKAPGVSVDNDGNISLKGKRGVSIMLDGKLTYLSASQLTSLLRATSGNSIETIELMSNPSAKYDAAGSAGIINIKLKKNMNYGTNGTVTAGGGYGKFYKANGGLNLNHRSKNLNLFGNYNYDNSKDFEDLNVQRSNTSGAETTYFNQQARDINLRKNNTYKAGLDYSLNDNNILGFMTTGYINNNNSYATSTTLIGSKPFAVDSTIIAANPVKSQFKNQTYNLNYKSVLDTSGQELNADLDYSKFHSINEIVNNNFFYNTVGQSLKAPVIFRSATPADVKILAAKVDYIYPFSSKMKLETGIKSSYVKTDNDYQFEGLENGTWQNDPSRSNRFVYKEYINAAYANFHREFKSTTVQIGLRTELTNSEGNSLTIQNLVKRQYIDFFPNASISQVLSKDHEIGLSYSRRIDRPDYQSLNPFVYFADLYTFYKGNPLLNPQYTNSFSFTYGYKKKLNISIGYSHTKDVITSTFITDTLKKTLTLFDQNLALQTLYDLNISLPVQITKWWNTTNDVSVFHRTFSTPELMGAPFESKKVTYTLNTIQTFTLAPSVNAELSFNYQSPQVYGTYAARPVYATNMGISKSFANNKANLKLAVNDVFNTQKLNIRSAIPMQDYQLSQKQESRVFRLTFSYNFGSTAIKAVRERINGSAGEQQRVKSGN